MRIALGIEYNGHGYYGWQFQRELKTIEGELQTALAKVANHEVFLHCAGRTDANVHAMGQVVHFDTTAKRHIDAWIWGANTHLPASIIVKWAKPVDYHFHARFTATARRYRYIIYNHPIRPALLSKHVTWHYYPLDAEKMHVAAQFLLGEQDFSSFRSSQCGSKTAMRCVTECTIFKQDNVIIMDIEANAFLHHMVRNIAGVLLKIGGGQREPAWMQQVLLAKNRREAAETAPPFGLYLTHVRYPDAYAFPPAEPLFLLK